ncbi:uncharacterized protein [Mytilus edulis]|uniref:uncharacterized protein n=1 Tax=Mytilus edulis TaxID=6550 RepID=UPI0039F09BFF
MTLGKPLVYICHYYELMSLLKISDAVFSFRCPVQSHWKHRADTICGSNRSYLCLHDKNKNKFVEFCRDHQDFEAPGRKNVVAGSTNGTLQGADCNNYLYQPFKFLTSGNSRCVYKTSSCSEKGQVVYKNGTKKNDILCRCDYTRGYDFIIKPKHPCKCVPSEEDCSCHLKSCSSNDILSPDYECLNTNDWKTSFTCQLIEAVGFPGNSKSLSTVEPLFGLYATEKFEIEKYRKEKVVAVSSLILFVIRLDEIATHMANETNGIENNSVALDLEDDKQELKDKIGKLDNLKVPSHVEEFQIETLQDWTTKLNRIVITRATKFIYEKVRAHKVIVIAGPTGAGKSAIAYYAAFRLKEESGYTIIPARQSVDITNYHVQGTKQVFIIDDFIGRYSVDETAVGLWEKDRPLLEIICSNNDDTKLILTSRTYIWQPERYSCLSLDACMCDLLSDHICLSMTERRDICQSYLNQDEVKALKDETLLMYSFFPSICSSYESSEKIPVESFFAGPYMMIETEIDNFKINSQISFIVLAILAIKQTISKSSFSIDNREYDELIKDVFDESAFLQYPSKNLLKSSLVAHTGTYVKHVVENDTDNFMFDHETLQKIVLRCIARTLIKSVIKYCKTEVILDQLRLNCICIAQDNFTIEVMPENEDAYFKRLVYELDKGWYMAIFKNAQHKDHQFRISFLKYLKKYLPHDNRTKIQNGFPVLHVVTALGYLDYVIFFMQDNSMINQQDSDGNIPLHLACMKGHNEIVKELVKKKSIINIANNEGLKPFVYACENEAIQVAKVMLHQCAKWINVNEKFPRRKNRTVLHIVSAKGCTHFVLLLLAYKAHVDERDENGCTPLHLASSSAVVKALLDVNANINQVDSFGRSPLYSACSKTQVRVVQLLIEKKAEINPNKKAGLRPLQAACQSGSTDIVKMLVKKGATVNIIKPGISPLHEACTIGNESITNILIATNASVNHKTKDGFSPLHQACMNDHVTVAKILLDNKANINDANKYGWTALLFSSAKGFCTVVDLLVQHGANMNLCDDYKVSPLMAACKEDKKGVVHLLLRLGANVNHCDKDNCSSLLVACKTGNIDLVNVLLTYGADINLADKDMITPLHAACMNNNNTNTTKLVLKLVESNANVNAADKTGQTPLFKSILNRYTDIVDILTRHGASVDIRDKSGNSPLAIAELKRHTTIVDVLRLFKPNNQKN